MPRYPATREREYQRVLLAYVRATHDITKKHLLRVIRRHKHAIEGTRMDDAFMVSAFEFALKDAQIEAAQLAFDFAILADLARKTESFNRRTLSKVLGVSVNQSPARSVMMETWALENAHLITTIQPLYFEQVAKSVTDALTNGTRPRELARDISRRFDVTRSRAKLIARDQIASLNAKITKDQQTSVGVFEYRWSTSGDERVRDLHVELNRTVRRWTEPHPTEGHPGEAINCRCVAIPILRE